VADPKTSTGDFTTTAAEVVGRTLGTIVGTVDRLKAEHPHPIAEAQEVIAQGQAQVAHVAAGVGERVAAVARVAKTGVTSVTKVVKKTARAAVKQRKKIAARSKPKKKTMKLVKKVKKAKTSKPARSPKRAKKAARKGRGKSRR
jgi:hypothetical protein